jgi:hypothetical protein
MKFFFQLKNEKTRIILFFLLLLTLPLSFQCVKMPLEFKAPQWQVPLNIGLIDRTYTFEQMIQKDPKFIVDSSTQSVVYRPASLVNQPTPITLPELTPAPSSVSNKLGLVPASIPTIPVVNVTFKDMFGADPPPGAYPGPDASAQISNNIANPNPPYDYVVFANGRMVLTITNTFPFAISFQSPGVQLINIDQGQGVVATFAFPTIASNQSATSTANVSGELMSANLKMSFTVQTSGITGTTITSTEGLKAQLSIDGGTTGSTATLQSAKVQLSSNYQVANIPDSAVQLIDDSTGIKRAEFSDGKFQIKIANGIATSVVVGFRLNEFVNRVTGQPFMLENDATGDITGIVPANGTFIQTVNMSDYAIQSQHDTVIGGRADTLSTTNVHFSINIKTLGATGGNKVLISKDDSVRVDVTPLNNNQSPPRKTYVLSKVIGKLKPTTVPLYDTVDASIGDIGKLFTADSVKFDSISITLKILSKGLFPTDLSMKVIGLDNNGNPRATLTAQEVTPGGGLTNVLRINPGQEKDIVFDKTTSLGGYGIDQFLASFFTPGIGGSLPSKLIVTGQAVVDPASYYQYPDSTGTVEVGDSVYTSVEFTFPVTIGIINGTFLDTVVISDTSGNKIDKKSLTQIDSGNVIFTISNGFPLQVSVGSKLLPGLAYNKSIPDPTVVLLSLPKVGVIQADSARYFSRPNSPMGLSGTVISLSPNDIEQINPANFIALKIKLNTSGSNEPVEFKTSYYVQLKAFVSVVYNVNFDKLK